MGQCITIEVSGQQKTKDASLQQIENAKDPLNKRVAKKDPRASDTETSDDGDLEAEAEEEFVMPAHMGKQQSPINIITTDGAPNCSKPMPPATARENPLRIHYPDEVRECTIVNTGHTVQVNIPEHSGCSLFINNKRYPLRQFHFHVPSEHMIDHKQYEMEMHLVHITDAGEIAVLGFVFTTKQLYFARNNKLTKAREYLVKKSQQIIANFGKPEDEIMDQEVCSDDEEEAEQETVGAPRFDEMNEEERRRSSVRQVEGNDFLDQFFDQLPLKKTTEEIRLSRPISFDYLFEAASKTFKRSVETNEIHVDFQTFEYDGSLTTPPYTEGVQWIVNKHLHFINAKQLNKLSSCWGHHQNARECHAYFGRHVHCRHGLAMKGYFFN